MTDISKTGELQIITGSMCSGKSTELLRRGMRYTYSNKKVLCINHKFDTRNKGYFSTHNKLYKSKNINNLNFVSACKLSELINDESSINLDDYDVLCIDEGQFFPDLKEQVTYLVEIMGKIVLLSGLTNDFKRKKFGQILDLEPIANSFTKLSALCKYCSDNKKMVDAIFSHRTVKETEINVGEQIKVGGIEQYVPLCRTCYLNANKI